MCTFSLGVTCGRRVEVKDWVPACAGTSGEIVPPSRVTTQRGPRALEGRRPFSLPSAGTLAKEFDRVAVKRCDHSDQIRDVTPSALGCEECLKTGSPWVHLRLCRTCGHVGCCDSSPNRHATA